MLIKIIVLLITQIVSSFFLSIVIMAAACNMGKNVPYEAKVYCRRYF